MNNNKRISVTVTGFRLFSEGVDPSDDFLCFLFSDCDSSQMSENELNSALETKAVCLCN